MVRAVQHLQSLAIAPQLYAFTSLWRFYVTTSPAYQEAQNHHAASIIWRWPHGRFRLSFAALANGWVDDWEPHQLCEEAAFPSSVEPLIRRLVDSTPSSAAGGTS